MDFGIIVERVWPGNGSRENAYETVVAERLQGIQRQSCKPDAWPSDQAVPGLDRARLAANWLSCAPACDGDLSPLEPTEVAGRAAFREF